MNKILCYDCGDLKKIIDDYSVECHVKGTVDIHGVCNYYWKKKK